MDQKTAYRPYNLQDFQFQSIWRIHTTQEQKSSPIQEPARYLNSYFFKEDKEIDRNKVFNIANHEGNASQDHNEILPNFSKNDYYMTITKKKR